VIRVSLPAVLAALAPDASAGGRPTRSFELCATTWDEVVVQVQAKHPELADRIFDGGNGVAAGIIVAVDADMVDGSVVREVVRDGVVLTFVPQISGGA
jgi:molybdopterin converting factor small subunit